MKKLVMSQEEIQAICKRLGEQISADLKDEEKIPLFLGVLKGAINFTMDLTKNVTIPLFMDYIQMSSYSGTKTTGEVRLVKDLTFDVKDRVIVVIEDVIDSGISMNYLVKHLYEHYQPKKVLVCTMFDKVNARVAPLKVDYAGKILIDNEFLIGYGLDYCEFDRNIPYVYVPTEEEIKKFDELKAK